MSKVQMLRSLVKQRLTAAAEEIFGLFERTIAEYEEELSSSKEENERQRRLLDAVFNPEVRIQRADVQQLLVVKQEVPPEEQDWSSILDQEDQEDQEEPEPPHIKEDQEDQEDQEEPEPPHIKEEQEELWTSEEGEQLQGLQEAGIKDCGGPEPDRKSDPEPDRKSEPDSDTDEKPGDSSDPDTDDCDDWKRNTEPPSGSNSQRTVVDERCLADQLLCICAQCGKRFGNRTNLKVHMLIHTGLKPFSCTICSKRFPQKKLLRHMKRHRCSVCNERFRGSGHAARHEEAHRRDGRDESATRWRPGGADPDI